MLLRTAIVSFPKWPGDETNTTVENKSGELLVWRTHRGVSPHPTENVSITEVCSTSTLNEEPTQ